MASISMCVISSLSSAWNGHGFHCHPLASSCCPSNFSRSTSSLRCWTTMERSDDISSISVTSSAWSSSRVSTSMTTPETAADDLTSLAFMNLCGHGSPQSVLPHTKNRCREQGCVGSDRKL